MINYLKKTYTANEFRLFLSIIYLLSFYSLYRLFIDINLWWLLIAIIWTKFIGLFGHSIGMHRYFSHRSFNTSTAGENFLAWISLLLGAGSPIQYARNHRQHHRVADQPMDWHSPKISGKLYTALGLWEFNNLAWFVERGGVTPRDLVVNPTCMFIHNNYYRIWYSLLILTALIDWRISVYLLALPSFFTHLDYNILTNCVGHSWGYRNFETNDNSGNNPWIKMFSWGEAYHNNHHAHPNLYDFAVTQDESDLTAKIIEKFLAVNGPQTQTGKLKIARII